MKRPREKGLRKPGKTPGAHTKSSPRRKCFLDTEVEKTFDPVHIEGNISFKGGFFKEGRAGKERVGGEN